MFHYAVNDRTELRLLGPSHAGEIFPVLDANRAHVRRWHPFVDLVGSQSDCERAIITWQLQHAQNRGFYAGIWFDGNFCGMINHLTVDWANQWTALSYWLAENHQGRGIMTSCCRAMVWHGFQTWKLNRITIECAADNARSRAIPERLGFKLDGIIRSIEWLHDHYADHAVYGLLKSEFVPGPEVASGRLTAANGVGISETNARVNHEPSSRIQVPK
jgi:ribosomal-protein-serine acetyltransferase